MLQIILGLTGIYAEFRKKTTDKIISAGMIKIISGVVKHDQKNDHEGKNAGSDSKKGA
jgi:hypothetical protein